MQMMSCGPTLTQQSSFSCYLQNRSLYSDQAALRWALQLALALEYLHAHKASSGAWAGRMHACAVLAGMAL